MTVRSMIERVMGVISAEAGEKCKGWAATEVLESGDGKWNKVCLPISFNAPK